MNYELIPLVYGEFRSSEVARSSDDTFVIMNYELTPLIYGEFRSSGVRKFRRYFCNYEL